MRKISDIFISNVKSVAYIFKLMLSKLVSLLVLCMFITLIACIDVYISSEISILLGMLLILPLVFIGVVIMGTWYDLVCEWNL